MPKARNKYSLTAQIAEAKREVALREGVYPRFVARGRMNSGEAEMHIDLMRNVVETLEWLKQNETTVKTAVARKDSA